MTAKQLAMLNAAALAFASCTQSASAQFDISWYTIDSGKGLVLVLVSLQ